VNLNFIYVRFGVFTGIRIQLMVLIVILCNEVVEDQHSGGPCQWHWYPTTSLHSITTQKAIYDFWDFIYAYCTNKSQYHQLNHLSFKLNCYRTAYCEISSYRYWSRKKRSHVQTGGKLHNWKNIKDRMHLKKLIPL